MLIRDGNVSAEVACCIIIKACRFMKTVQLLLVLGCVIVVFTDVFLRSTYVVYKCKCRASKLKEKLL